MIVRKAKAAVPGAAALAVIIRQAFDDLRTGISLQTVAKGFQGAIGWV